MKINIVIYKIKFLFALLFFFNFLFSCQPIENLDDIVFDNNLLYKISINAKQKEINNYYEVKFNDTYIDSTLKYPPLLRTHNSIEENISVFGSRNTFTIEIIEASLSKKEQEIENKKIFEEKSEFLYQINLIVNYILSNENNFELAKTTVEVRRTITSSKFISLNEEKIILDQLILNALIDLSKKTDELLNIHMSKYIL